jgi:hypothetical protein
LPDDIHVLRQMVLQLLANVDSLQHELGWYKRHLFGRRSEKLDPNQQMLFDLLGQASERRRPRPLSRRLRPKPLIAMVVCRCPSIFRESGSSTIRPSRPCSVRCAARGKSR